MTTTAAASAIQTAIDKYVHDNKLDPIAKKQIDSWKLTWKEEDEIDQAKVTSSPTPTASSSSLLPNIYSGQLVWTSADGILVVTLYSACSWSETLLEWTCRARVTFSEKPQDKTQKKIYKRLKSRLEQDDYISKLFVKNQDKGEGSNSEESLLLGDVLAQASVNTANNGLEERVWTNSDLAEGIRRSIWNSAEAPIDVLEFVIQYLPLLPCVHSVELKQTTSLADRAVLRLLEDAMCEACDREGEEEVLQDLHIRKKGRTDD
jgi:hypothetical protein